MEWIKIEDELPEYGKNVLGYHPTMGMGQTMRLYCNSYLMVDLTSAYKITHWMPLPDPPKDNQ